jgi:hypothetical protein
MSTTHCHHCSRHLPGDETRAIRHGDPRRHFCLSCADSLYPPAPSAEESDCYRCSVHLGPQDRFGVEVIAGRQRLVCGSCHQIPTAVLQRMETRRIERSQA